MDPGSYDDTVDMKPRMRIWKARRGTTSEAECSSRLLAANLLQAESERGEWDASERRVSKSENGVNTQFRALYRASIAFAPRMTS